jgi:predicted nucleic acid-binding protein
MSDRRFTLDTNILVYVLDRQAGDKRGVAGRIIDLAVWADCCLTLPSISEFYAAVTRKRLVPMASAHDQALDWLDMFPTVSASAGAVRTALTTAAAGKAPYWDALLVITATEAGCNAILTEDLPHGTVLAGVRIINPFAGAALSAEAEALLTQDWTGCACLIPTRFPQSGTGEGTCHAPTPVEDQVHFA